LGSAHGVVGSFVGASAGAFVAIILASIFGPFLVVGAVIAGVVDVLLHLVIGLPVKYFGNYYEIPPTLSIVFHIVSGVIGLVACAIGWGAQGGKTIPSVAVWLLLGVAVAPLILHISDRNDLVPPAPAPAPGNSTVQLPPVTPPVANTPNKSTNVAVPTSPSETIGSPSSVKVIDLGGGVTMEFVLIQPGTFMMGADKENERPAHQVTLTKPFDLGKYEVTQEQWEIVMGSNPSTFRGAKNPVEMVSWDLCQQFVAKLQAKVPGQTFRLPTEAEWEYACRASTTGDYCYGDGEGSLAEYAWYKSNANNTPHPVGEKKPNAWGLYDMHGNVWEWCADSYGAYPATAVNDPQGASSGSIRVYRGGNWDSDAYYCRVAGRVSGYPTGSYYAVGFRLARSSVP
jgi:formylglycine-generating enzyme required for sulfatase activity